MQEQAVKNYVTDEVLKRVDMLAEKLQIGVEEIFPWFVRQVYIDSLLAWLGFILLAVITYKASMYAVRHWNPTRKMGRWDNDPDDGHKPPKPYDIVASDHEVVWLTVIAILVCGVWVSVLVWFVVGFNFLNPKLHAFKALLKTIIP